MARREIDTDFWVKSMLGEAGIALTAQGGGTKEIEAALQRPRRLALDGRVTQSSAAR